MGPRPIPIDSLTTKKLVQALEFMQKPEVKREAEKVSALIKQASSHTLWPKQGPITITLESTVPESRIKQDKILPRINLQNFCPCHCQFDKELRTFL